MIKLIKDTIIENNGQQIKIKAGSILMVIKESVSIEPVKISVERHASENSASAVTFYYNKKVTSAQVREFIKNNPDIYNTKFGNDENHVHEMWGDLSPCDVQCVGNIKGFQVWQAYPSTGTGTDFDQLTDRPFNFHKVPTAESKKINDFEFALSKIK